MANKTVAHRVAELLNKAFPDVSVDIEPPAGSQRVYGWIAWDGFKGLDQAARQRRLREVLSSLPKADQVQIGPILTLTISEASDGEEAA